MRTFSRAAAALTFAALPVMAASAQGSGTPQAPVQGLNQALMQAEKDGSKPFQARYDALAPAVDRAFNLQQILQTGVGLRWTAVPADQKQQLLKVFRAYTITSYASDFSSDSGDKIEVLPETRSLGADKVIETQIQPKSGEPTRIDYVMRQGPSGWQAVDVLLQGTISQAAVQRSDFRSQLEGGGAQKLIASLQANVDKKSGGTIRP